MLTNRVINGQICAIPAMLIPFVVCILNQQSGYVRAPSLTLALSPSPSLVPRAEPAVISPQANDYVKTTTQQLRKASMYNSTLESR